MNIKWKLGRHSGVVVADSEKEAMAEVLGNPPFEPKPDECYSFSFGGLTGNAYGDEFERMAGASSLDESKLDTSSGYLHDDPVRKQLEENVDPKFMEAVEKVGKEMNRRTAERMMEELVNRTPVDTGRMRASMPNLQNIYPNGGNILGSTIRKVMEQQAEAEERIARDRVVRMAIAKSSGPWSPSDAKKVYRDMARQTVVVEFDNGANLGEQVMVSEAEIANVRGF